MIEYIYKKIRLYFIDRKIKKIHKETTKLHNELMWVKDHIHDISTTESFVYVKSINTKLRLCNMELNSYKEDKERLMK